MLDKYVRSILVLAVLVLQLGPRQTWLVSCTARTLYPTGKTFGNHWTGGWECHRAGLHVSTYKKSLCIASDRTPDCPARSKVGRDVCAHSYEITRIYQRMILSGL